MSSPAATPPVARRPPPLPPPSPEWTRADRPRRPRQWPPDLGRYSWWAPLAALALGLVVLAPPFLLLRDGYFPFAATLGQTAFLLAMFGAAYLLTRGRGGLPSASELGLRPTPARAAVGWVVVARFAFVILVAVYVAAAGPPHPNVPVGLDDETDPLVAADIVIAALLLAPVGEELFFRGLMYGTLRRKVPVFWAALVSGVLFGAVHPLYGGTHWDLVPVIALAGGVMCLLYERTGSLWPPIAFHFVLNVGVLTMVTGSAALPLAIVGALALLFLVAPWRFAGRERQQTQAHGAQWQTGRASPA